MSFKSRKGEKVVKSSISLYADEWAALDIIGAEVPCKDRTDTVRYLLQKARQETANKELAEFNITGAVADPSSHDWDDALTQDRLFLIATDFLQLVKSHNNREALLHRARARKKTLILVEDRSQFDPSRFLSEENFMALKLVMRPTNGITLEDMCHTFIVHWAREQNTRNFVLLNDTHLYIQPYRRHGDWVPFALKIDISTPKDNSLHWHMCRVYDNAVDDDSNLCRRLLGGEADR